MSVNGYEDRLVCEDPRSILHLQKDLEKALSTPQNIQVGVEALMERYPPHALPRPEHSTVSSGSELSS